MTVFFEWLGFVADVATIIGLIVAILGIRKANKSINKINQNLNNFGSGTVQNIGTVENLHVTGTSNTDVSSL